MGLGELVPGFRRTRLWALKDSSMTLGGLVPGSKRTRPRA